MSGFKLPEAPSAPRITAGIQWEYPTPMPPPTASASMSDPPSSSSGRPPLLGGRPRATGRGIQIPGLAPPTASSPPPPLMGLPPIPPEDFSLPSTPPRHGVNLDLTMPMRQTTGEGFDWSRLDNKGTQAAGRNSRSGDDAMSSAPAASFVSSFGAPALPALPVMAASGGHDEDDPARPPKRSQQQHGHFRPPSPPRLSELGDSPWRRFDKRSSSSSRRDKKDRGGGGGRSERKEGGGSSSGSKRPLFAEKKEAFVGPHRIRMKPVRNDLFSMVDEHVDEEYLDIFCSSLRHAAPQAAKKRASVVVVVGAQRMHFRTVLAKVESCFPAGEVMGMADVGSDTWGSFAVRKFKSLEEGKKTPLVVVTNGFLPFVDLKVDVVLGFGLPIVGYSDAKKLAAAWCAYLDAMLPWSGSDLWADLWVESSCEPEIAGVVDFARSREGKVKADFEMPRKFEDIAKVYNKGQQQGGSSLLEAGGRRSKSPVRRRGDGGSRRRRSGSPRRRSGSPRRRRSGSPRRSPPRRVILDDDRSSSRRRSRSPAAAATSVEGKHDVAYSGWEEDIFRPSGRLSAAVSERLKMEVERHMRRSRDRRQKRKRGEDARPLVVLVIDGGEDSTSRVNKLVADFQEVYGVSRVLGVLDDDLSRWKVRMTVPVADEVEVLVMDGFIPVAGRTVTAVHALDLPARERERDYHSHMKNWCQFLDDMTPDDCGHRVRGDIPVKMWLCHDEERAPKAKTMLAAVKSWLNDGGGYSLFAGPLPGFFYADAARRKVGEGDLRKVLQRGRSPSSSSSSFRRNEEIIRERRTARKRRHEDAAAEQSRRNRRRRDDDEEGEFVTVDAT